MWIMTANGWKQISPRSFDLPGHTPSLLERMGIDQSYSGVKAMAEYCNSQGNGVYFTYTNDGRQWQSKPALHPLPGMFGELAQRSV